MKVTALPTAPRILPKCTHATRERTRYQETRKEGANLLTQDEGGLSKRMSVAPSRHDWQSMIRKNQDSVLAVAGVRPCEEKCPFPRVAGKRGRSLEF